MARPVMIEHRLDAFVFTDWHFVTAFCNQSALHTLCNMQRKDKEVFMGLCKKWRQDPAKVIIDQKALLQCDEPAPINMGTPVYTGVLRKSPVKRPYFCDFARIIASAMVFNSHFFIISCLNEVFRAPLAIE